MVSGLARDKQNAPVDGLCGTLMAAVDIRWPTIAHCSPMETFHASGIARCNRIWKTTARDIIFIQKT